MLIFLAKHNDFFYQIVIFAPDKFYLP